MFRQKIHMLASGIVCSEERISTQRIFPGRISGAESSPLPAELKLQIHTYHTSLPCPSPENTHLALTEVSIMAMVELISLCVVCGININHRNFGVP